jgi:hypothetical protein
MSASVEGTNETYEVRGREVSLQYNPETHQVTVSADGLEHAFGETRQDPQETLESLGVFTRVADIVDFEGNEMTVTLKPAASVELRDTQENNKQLLKRPIGKQFDGSTISKRRGKYGYHATVSVSDLRAIGLNHREPAAVYPEVDNGFLALRVVPEEAPHSMIVRTDTTGLIRLPNVLGSAVDLDGHGAKWEVVLDDFEVSDVDLASASEGQLDNFAEFLEVSVDGSEEDTLRDAIEDEGYTVSDVRAFIDEADGSLPGITGTLYGVTTRELKELSYSEKESEEGDWTTITHVGQDGLEHDGTSWSQEHFKSYLLWDQAKELGWEPGDYVDIHLGRFGDDELGIRLDGEPRTQFIDTDDDGELRVAPCIRKLYEMGNNQLNFYFPNALAYAMGVADEQVFWVVTGGEMLGRLNHRR